MKTDPQVSFTENHTKETSRLTKIWDCHSKSGTHLGIVKWWAHWRRYCFFPDARLLFDADCMRDIADFIFSQTQEQKEDQARRRQAKK
jgi:hypothetical protein